MDGQKDDDVILIAWKCFLLRPISILGGAFKQLKRIGLGLLCLVNLARETAVFSLAVQPHCRQYICRFFHLSDEIDTCSGFENWSNNIIGGPRVFEQPLSFCPAVVRLPIRHILTNFRLILAYIGLNGPRWLAISCID